MKNQNRVVLSTAMAVGLATGCAQGDAPVIGEGIGSDREELIGDADFGAAVEDALRNFSFQLFGVFAPLEESASPVEGPIRLPGQAAVDQLALAEGLNARFLTRQAAHGADMMVLWPSVEDPTHLIYCIEGEREVIGGTDDVGGQLNPSIQSVSLFSGEVQTLVRGLNNCSSLTRTPWGTLLAAEEIDEGTAYEIIQPLELRDAVIIDPGELNEPGEISSEQIVKRVALPTIPWEGLEVLPSGVVIGTFARAVGALAPERIEGAIFKFVPATPRTGTELIADLSQSPLTEGTTYVLQVSCRPGEQLASPACDLGVAAWIEVAADNALTDALAVGATLYFQPEQLELDRQYADVRYPEAVRFCWANQAHQPAANFGKVLCALDAQPAAAPDEQSVVVELFLPGNPAFNMFDTLAFQPRTGNMFIAEQATNPDVISCLRDRSDRDLLTDGCIRMMSLRDSEAHISDIIFTADGTVAFVSIHSLADDMMPMSGGVHTDDIIIVTGFATF